MNGTLYVSIDMTATGKKIETLRKVRDITISEMVNTLGLTSPRAYYKWRAGICLPSIDNLCVLSSMFDTTIDELIVRSA
jgi:transcriptional regulator with XRE-family HTH domain